MSVIGKKNFETVVKSTLLFGFQWLFCVPFWSLAQKHKKYWDKTVLKMWSQNFEKKSFNCAIKVLQQQKKFF